MSLRHPLLGITQPLGTFSRALLSLLSQLHLALMALPCRFARPREGAVLCSRRTPFCLSLAGFVMISESGQVALCCALVPHRLTPPLLPNPHPCQEAGSHGWEKVWGQAVV